MQLCAHCNAQPGFPHKVDCPGASYDGRNREFFASLRPGPVQGPREIKGWLVTETAAYVSGRGRDARFIRVQLNGEGWTQPEIDAWIAAAEVARKEASDARSREIYAEKAQAVPPGRAVKEGAELQRDAAKARIDKMHADYRKLEDEFKRRGC